MTRPPNRTRPLDRDGDGRDGGSLPGNRTAPLQDATSAPPPEQPPTTTETDAPDWPAPIRPVSDEHRHVPAEGEAETPAPADAAEDGETVAATDEPAQLQDTGSADVPPPEPTVAHEDGETVAPAEPAPVAPETELSVIETTTAPVAVRLDQLRRLADNRFFYLDETGGYSPSYAPPHVDREEAALWIKHGWATHSPTAGRLGGLRITPEGRRIAARPREIPLLDGDAA